MNSDGILERRTEIPRFSSRLADFLALTELLARLEGRSTKILNRLDLKSL